MKVGMYTTVGERCGIAAYTNSLINALRSLPDTEVEVVPIEEGRQPKEHYVEVAERLNAGDIDVVHVQHEHSFWGGILPGHSAYWEFRYLIEKPIVLTAHTTYTAEEMLRYRTERRPLKKLAKWLLLRNRSWVDSVQIAPFITAITIVHTEEAKQQLIERGADPKFVHVVPAGVPEVIAAATGGEAFRRRFGLNGFRVITIFGYIAPNKGYELTLKLLPSLPEDVKLVIAGGPRNAAMEPYFAQLRNIIESSGVQDRVVITGYLRDEEVAEAMAASSVVLTPHTEATGSYSVTIPLAYGKAVLASDLACFREITQRIACLELFRAGDIEDFRQHLLQLLNDEARRATLERHAKEYAERYSWHCIAERTRTIYEEALRVYAPVTRRPYTLSGKRASF
jgi:glycosyltransferase involved in cell wall biosynthesis